jgi:leader peptidase (prepilin peptidase) / N-methyltransferase
MIIETTPYWLAILLGLALGSFNNVLIYRIPAGLSLLRPASSCPNCNTRIRIYDNLPLISWLILRGRCRSCDWPIPIRYPLVELLTAVLCLAVSLKWPLQIEMFAFIPMLSLLLALSVIDIDHLRLPNVLVISVGVIGIIAVNVNAFLFSNTTLTEIPNLLDAFLGSLAGGGSLLLVAVISRIVLKKDGMGMGDVKLMFALGLFLGWRNVLLSIFLGSVLGLITALAGRRGYGREFPFGPSLAGGSVIALFYGNEIIQWYINFVLGF